KAYHARPGSGPFGQGEAIDIRAPSGRTMAFIELPDSPAGREAQAAKADARLIVDALNAYQPPPPQRSPQEGIPGTLRKQLEAKPTPSRGNAKKPKRPQEPERTR